ncbi:hypothetical protein [Kitasatospora sp. NPDC057198]|uniref:hypothetical protein n=1 Tax=Kitasatospora sp. NPDC057198 TaxID=3346046 RepID=UPI00362B6B9C
MSTAVAFFLAPADRDAASAHRGGPHGRFAAVLGRHFCAEDAVDDWDAYFVGPSSDQLFWQRTDWIVPMTHDGSGMFAFPPRLTRALAGASVEELEDLANRWSERLRCEDGEDMTDDNLLAIVQAVAELATKAGAAGGNLYCWFF